MEAAGLAITCTVLLGTVLMRTTLVSCGKCAAAVPLTHARPTPALCFCFCIYVASSLSGVFALTRTTGSRKSEDDKSNCGACPPGEYKSSLGSETCSMCESGRYNSMFAATECTQCPTSSHSLPGSRYAADCMCNVGYTGRIEVDAELISTVEKHFVAISLGNSTNDIVDGSTTWRGINYPNVTYIETFAPGPVNWTGGCLACVPGSYKEVNGSSACARCAEGKFSNASGATSISTCTNCSAHSNSQRGTGDITGCHCVPGHTGANGGPCLPCVQGTYKALNGSAPCSQCEVGKYVDFAGAVECLECPPGLVAPAGSDSVGDCFYCPAGTFSPGLGEACMLCEAGKYGSLYASTGCQDCAANADSQPGAILPSDCVCNAGLLCLL